MQRIIATALFLLSSWALAAGGPQELVRQTADSVLHEVTSNKAMLEADPAQIYDLVQRAVVPRFDFRRMAKSALGRFWRDASEDQRARLTHEFRELLVRTYATALLGYSGQKIEYLPVHMKAGAKKVKVPTRISDQGAPSVPVNYSLRLNGDNEWMVYDVVIDGISLVTNYRSTFKSQVRRGGLDGLIKTLADKNAKSRG